MGDLMALLGDGLLTIDGDFHRSWRRIMPPAFHRERIEAAQATMEAETNAALAGVRAGEPLNLDAWTSELALRIAMRALFGLDRTARGAISLYAAAEFEAALGFYARDYALHRARARTPWARMQAACHRLDAPILGEIAGRRAGGAGGEDVLSPLLDARDDAGDTLSDRHVRDEAMTLLLAGHDTTTSTVAFLFHEPARRPELVEDAAFDLGAAMDDTLRLYAAAWIGPRR